MLIIIYKSQKMHWPAWLVQLGKMPLSKIQNKFAKNELLKIIRTKSKHKTIFFNKKYYLFNKKYQFFKSKINI